ncbi:MAG TPA: hypothetical protein VG737_12880 [Cyclobacteriaceae bacterium]|nr:hypothetical protein [Cyclobacteriaceae bacterium]
MRPFSISVVVVFASLTALSVCAQDTWKFRKDKTNIVATNTTTGKERVMFTDSETTTVDDGDSIDTSLEYALISYVGPYVTVLKSEYSYMKGAAHPNSERIFEVIDAATNKPVKLTDFFNEQDILTALMQDSYIKGALKKGVVPKNLAQLAAGLENTDVARFGDYMYGSFAFHHVEPGKVAVRMGLAYSYGAASGAFTQLGFFLPIPEKLKAPLAAAAANKTLMKDLHPKIPQLE